MTGRHARGERRDIVCGQLAGAFLLLAVEDWWATFEESLVVVEGAGGIRVVAGGDVRHASAYVAYIESLD